MDAIEAFDPIITEWYKSDGSQDYDSFIQDTYETAREMFRKLCNNNTLPKDWTNASFTMRDAQVAVSAAMKVYEQKSESSTFKWISALSTRIVHYGVVLDVLVQHHPEYVSLAWGTFKLVFMAVANRDIIVKEISKALSKIADVLPRVTLALRLYRTAQMKRVAATLYTRLMRFFIKIQKWLDQGKLSHTFSSIFQPWAIGFEDSLAAYEGEAKKLAEYAESALQAEMRDMHIELTLARKELVQTRELLQQAVLDQTGVNLSIRADLREQKETIGKIHSATLLSQPFLSHLPTAGECLAFCRSFRKRSHQGRDTSALVSNVAVLESWSSHENSMLLAAEAPTISDARDFLVNLITTIKEANRPIIWSLRFPQYWETSLSAVDVLRMVVLHTIQINPAALTANSSTITAASLREASSEQDWLSLLNRALIGLDKVYIVLDSDLLSSALGRNRYHTTKWLDSVLGSLGSTAVKIVVSAANLDTSLMMSTWDSGSWLKLDVGRPQRPKTASLFQRKRHSQHRRAKRRH